LYTGLVYDACEQLGLRGRAMQSGIYPLVPTMKVAGPAFTVRCIATPSRDPNVHNVRLGMLKSMTPGCIQIRGVQETRPLLRFSPSTANGKEIMSTGARVGYRWELLAFCRRASADFDEAA